MCFNLRKNCSRFKEAVSSDKFEKEFLDEVLRTILCDRRTRFIVLMSSRCLEVF